LNSNYGVKIIIYSNIIKFLLISKVQTRFDFELSYFELILFGKRYKSMLQWAQSMGHLAQPIKSGPAHWSFSAQETEQGNQSPSSHQRRAARKGGAGELA
jgi:hypothetical protein